MQQFKEKMHNLKIIYRKKGYLDYNSTTPPLKTVIQGVKRGFARWGNPSSSYQFSGFSKNMIWESRRDLAHFLNCDPLELIFTSGASESNNFVLRGLEREGRREIIISSVEHPSVSRVAEELESQGFKIHRIPSLKSGELDKDFYLKSLSEKTLLVSIMLANNETGVIFPIKWFVEKAHQTGALFHSDMVQALGKVPIDLKELGIDFASFSAHKCYGLKGAGALYSKKGIKLKSLICGGSQERNRRAGTENILGIASFGVISKQGESIVQALQNLRPLRDEMESLILSSISQVEILGKSCDRLPNTSSLCIQGIQGETLLMSLDLKGFCVSVGSACSSGKTSASDIIQAMGKSQEEAKSCLRVSLGLGVSRLEVKSFIKALISSIQRIRSIEKDI